MICSTSVCHSLPTLFLIQFLDRLYAAIRWSRRMADLVPVTKNFDHGNIFLNGCNLWALLELLLKCDDDVLWMHIRSALLVRQCYPSLGCQANHLYYSISRVRHETLPTNLVFSFSTFAFSLSKPAHFVQCCGRTRPIEVHTITLILYLVKLSNKGENIGIFSACEILP